MLSKERGLFNYLTYQMIHITRQQQTIIIGLIALLTLAYVWLLRSVFYTISKPLMNSNVVEQEQALFFIVAITLTIMSFIGLRWLIMIADNPFSNPIHPKMFRGGWSKINSVIMLFIGANVIFAITGILPVMHAFDEGTNLYHAATAITLMYLSIVTASPLITNVLSPRGPNTGSAKKFNTFVMGTVEPPFSFISEQYINGISLLGLKETNNMTLRNMLDVHTNNRRISYMRETVGQTDAIHRTFTSFSNLNSNKQAMWTALSYLLVDRPEFAGRILASHPCKSKPWMKASHKQFFDLHGLPEDERIELLSKEIKAIDDNDLCEQRFMHFLDTWNLTPLNVMSVGGEFIKKCAINAMAKGQIEREVMLKTTKVR